MWLYSHDKIGWRSKQFSFYDMSLIKFFSVFNKNLNETSVNRNFSGATVFGRGYCINTAGHNFQEKLVSGYFLRS